MQIVVLDGYALNPGDLNWDALRALGPCAIHDRTPREEVVPRARDAEIVLTNKVVLGREQIAQLPKLRYIGVLATGYNIVDVQAASERNVAVANVPTYAVRFRRPDGLRPPVEPDATRRAPRPDGRRGQGQY